MAAPKTAQELPFGVACVFTAVGGLGLAAVSVWIVVASWVTFAYRPATATVVERRLNRHAGSKGGATYRLLVLLAYQVDGQEYSTWQELPNSTRHPSGPEADAVLNQLQPGQEVRCFHDPRNPGTAVLDTKRLSWVMLPGLATSTLFLLAGLGGSSGPGPRCSPTDCATRLALACGACRGGSTPGPVRSWLCSWRPHLHFFLLPRHWGLRCSWWFSPPSWRASVPDGPAWRAMLSSRWHPRKSERPA